MNRASQRLFYPLGRLFCTLGCSVIELSLSAFVQSGSCNIPFESSRSPLSICVVYIEMRSFIKCLFEYFPQGDQCSAFYYPLILFDFRACGCVVFAFGMRTDRDLFEAIWPRTGCAVCTSLLNQPLWHSYWIISVAISPMWCM